MLALQAIDTEVAQLTRRRTSLPVQAEITHKLAERKVLVGAYTEADTIVSDLIREQAKAEADLEPVRGRLARNQQRVDAGSISDPKVLQGLTEEIAHLGRRISTLEDAELELMEQLEEATARFADIQARRSSLEVEIRGLMAERDVQIAALDGQLQHARANRETVVAKLPAGLVSYYERIRDKHSGLGVAELVEGRCGGCRLEVNAAELRAFAEAGPDQLHLCEECGRILVRTSKSGVGA